MEMNEKYIVICFIIILFSAFLFPPWILERKGNTFNCGYSYLLKEKYHKILEEEISPSEQDRFAVLCRIDAFTWLVELFFIISCFFSIIYYFFISKK